MAVLAGEVQHAKAAVEIDHLQLRTSRIRDAYHVLLNAMGENVEFVEIRVKDECTYSRENGEVPMARFLANPLLLCEVQKWLEASREE